VLEELETQIEYQSLVVSNKEKVLQLFETVFNHKAFTGRSGTFYGYEGLGSIYWHMVSKLHLAVEEVCEKAHYNETNHEVIQSLQHHFDEIGDGIGIHKSAKVYGAFPTDPYSHTPWHRGAQQPGMTGQVKEDILTRIGELGIKIGKGKIKFEPILLKKEEFLSQETTVKFISVDGTLKSLKIDKQSLAFTYCQVPIIYTIAAANQIQLNYTNGESQIIRTLELSKEQSSAVFLRTNQIAQINVFVTEETLR
jgi:hypothetical protein